MKKKLILLLAFLMIASMFLAACGGADDEPAPDDDNGEAVDPDDDDDDDDVADEDYENLLMAGVTEIGGNFNPAYYSSAYDGYVVDFVFQPLMTRNFDGEWTMEAATDWEVSEDGTQVTFYMDESNVFSDGEPVTAHDVVWTYMLLSDPSYTGRYDSVARELAGFDEFRGDELGITDDDDPADFFEGVVALDDYTVQFTFKEALRTNIANTTMHIMPKHYYGAQWAYGRTEAIQGLNSRPMGSGPYIMEVFAPDQYVYLNRNPNYIFEDQFAIEEIILESVTMQTDVEEFMAGNVDLLSGQITPDDIRAVDADPDRVAHGYSRSGYGYIKTNHEHGPTTDPAVRQALYYSFNLQEFVDNYFEGYATTQFHPYSQVSWAVDDEWVESLPDYSFDLDRAAEILDDAGWTVGADGVREKDGETLTLNILAMPDHDILDTLIPMWERDWGEGLNIDLNVAYEEFNSILDTVIYDSDNNVEEWSMFFLATTITSYDPHGIVEGWFHSRNVRSGGNNTSRYRNEEVDRMIDEGERIMDDDEARPHYQEIGRILTEDAAFMPVYANETYDFYHNKLQNFETHSIYNWVAAMRDAYIQGHGN